MNCFEDVIEEEKKQLRSIAQKKTETKEESKSIWKLKIHFLLLLG